MKWISSSLTVCFVSAAVGAAWAQSPTVPHALQGPRVHDSDSVRHASAPGPVVHPIPPHARIHYHHAHGKTWHTYGTVARTAGSTADQLNHGGLTQIQGGAEMIGPKAGGAR